MTLARVKNKIFNLIKEYLSKENTYIFRICYQEQNNEKDYKLDICIFKEKIIIFSEYKEYKIIEDLYNDFILRILPRLRHKLKRKIYETTNTKTL